MQAHQSPAWATPILAFCLSLIFSITLAPVLGLVAYQQYDFWLLWLLTMLFLALPFMILEVALARRVRVTPLQGFMQLTRDADRSTKWRLLSWAAVILVPLLAGGILNFAAQHVQLQFQLSIASGIVVLILTIIAVAFSLLPRIILLLLTLFATLAVVSTGLMQGTNGTWRWTPIEFQEWAKVVVITLVTGGLGLGLYWQNALKAIQTQTGTQSQQKAMPIVLPIWLAQALGLAVFAVNGDIQSHVQTISFTVAALALAGLLLQYVREQLLDRQLPIALQAVVLLVPLLIWAIPFLFTPLYYVIIVLGLVLCLAYAIFTGWLMKISHLRKSINFSSEMTYNIWRIFIRLVLPVAIIVALAGWILALAGV